MRQNIMGIIGEIDSLPGCSQIAVSHSVFKPERGPTSASVGIPANKERQRIVFDELGYDYLVCSVDAANAKQIHILRSSGWHNLDEFTSRKTGHRVQIWGVSRRATADWTERRMKLEDPEIESFPVLKHTTIRSRLTTETGGLTRRRSVSHGVPLSSSRRKTPSI